MFVLDGSDSLETQDFNAMKQFVVQILQSLEVEADYARIGVIVFGTFVGTVPTGRIELNSTNTAALLSARVNALVQPKTSTRTSYALKAMTEMFNQNGKVCFILSIDLILLIIYGLSIYIVHLNDLYATCISYTRLKD